jgi:hypothetical protein
VELSQFEREDLEEGSAGSLGARAASVHHPVGNTGWSRVRRCPPRCGALHGRSTRRWGGRAHRPARPAPRSDPRSQS